MLKFSLSQDKIKNIAITGPYGSGKSRVLLIFHEKNLRC
ncbi:YobI family P-loop NTPase [Acinetobacter rudis]